MNALLKLLRVLLFILVGVALAWTIMHFTHRAESGFDSMSWMFGDDHHHNRLKGSDHLLTQTRAVQAFDAIELDSSGDFDISIADAQTVSLEAPDNLIGLITTRVEDRTLYIESKRDFAAYTSPKFSITLPQLKKVVVRGGGRMRIHGLRGDAFALNTEGAGDFTLDGIVKTVSIEIDGAAQIDARQLDAASVSIEVNGAGSAKVSARESLDASISGIGSITYSGHPAKVEKNVSGIGSIKPDDSEAKTGT